MNDCKYITNLNCEYLEVCNNNSCILRLQAVFGLRRFQQHIGFEEALSKANVSYAHFPKIEFVNKVHGVGITCQDFIGSSDE